MKDILNEVICRLDTAKSEYCRLKHKRGWLEFLEDGDPVFTPSSLHKTLREVIDTENNRPKGEKLFTLHRKTSFTMKNDGSPFRPEEALERFVVISNPIGFYNQLPIGGGKESVDIAITDDDKITFVELKPWNSNNSPFYAIVESLKNLIEYRIILERGIKDIPNYQTVGLCILAPDEYYERYSLTDPNGTAYANKMVVLRSLLNDILVEFNSKLSFMSFDLTKHDFILTCKKIYVNYGLEQQSIVTIHEKDAIENLKVDHWKPIVSME